MKRQAFNQRSSGSELSQKLNARFPRPRQHMGQMDDDHLLLRHFAGSGDEEAFTELVGRHLGMVHAICLRRTGSPQLAEELAQNVFASLARKAGSLKPDVLIAGWLHRAACLESLSALRSERTRQRTMKKYSDFQTIDESPNSDVLRGIAPLLDAAIDKLPTPDRDVVLMRFASGLTLRQIGEAIGKSESASQRHLQRVLEKLAVILRRSGVTTSAAVLALFLGANMAKAAPVSITAAFISKAAIASSTTAGAASLPKVAFLLSIMNNKAIVLATVCLLAAGGSIAYIASHPSGPKIASKERILSTAIPARPKSAAIAADDNRGNPRVRRNDPAGEFPDLAQRYGTSNVRLAARILANLIKTSDSVGKLMEMTESNPGMSAPFSVPGLEFDPEQKKQVDALLAKRRAEQREILGAQQAALTTDRPELMEILLAGDAAKLGTGSKADYDALLNRRKQSKVSAAGSPNPESAMSDDPSLEEISPILNDDQLATYTEFLAQKQAEREKGKKPDPNGDPLTFDLETPFTAEEPISLEEMDKQLEKKAAAFESLTRILESTSLKEGR